MSRSFKLMGALLALLATGAALAAGADVGQAAKQPTNWTAIGMFGAFVAGTLYITKWAASKTKSAADFYTGGGGITGFQNGLAIAGDYMSAASVLGISAAVMASGFDGLIYSIGFLVGWPVITFLMAERLRNLGKFTFADVAGYRFQQAPIRIFAASGTLVVVAFYLIAQVAQALGHQESNDRPADQKTNRIDQSVVAGRHHGGGNSQKGRGRHVVAGNRQAILEAGDAATAGVEVSGRLGLGRGPLGNEKREDHEYGEHADGHPVGGLLVHLPEVSASSLSRGCCEQCRQGGEELESSLHLEASFRISAVRRSYSPLARLT